MAVARSQTWRELPEELRTTPRSVAALGHPVFTESRTPPMAPYRAPEFVATQPGTRTPWSAPAEPPVPDPEAPPAQVRDLSLVIPRQADDGGPQEAVKVRVIERAGEVKLAVHTRDADLAQSLREDLGDLVRRLEQSGYRTEIWRPGEPPPDAVRLQDPLSDGDATAERRGDQPSSGHDSSHHQRQRRQDQPPWAETLRAAALGHGAAIHRQENLP